MPRGKFVAENADTRGERGTTTSSRGRARWKHQGKQSLCFRACLDLGKVRRRSRSLCVPVGDSSPEARSRRARHSNSRTPFSALALALSFVLSDSPQLELRFLSRRSYKVQSLMQQMLTDIFITKPEGKLTSAIWRYHEQV